jgi:hypothetical protein
MARVYKLNPLTRTPGSKWNLVVPDEKVGASGFSVGEQHFQERHSQRPLTGDRFLNEIACSP